MKVQRPWLVNVREIEWREEEIQLTPDKVLVRHVCTAPSLGTALHMYRGEHLAVDHVRETRPWPYPWLQGFAYGVGRVEEVGAKAAGVGVGDLVYSQKLTSERCAVSPADLLVLPKGLDAESASLVFQANVALHGVKSADVALGDNVLVTGQGIIGVFAAQLAGLAGARRVIVTDLSDKRLAVSREAGIDLTLNPRTDRVPERVRDLTGGRGADIVFEVSGSPKALEEGSRAAAPLARIAVVGWIMDPIHINLAEEFTPKGLEMIVCHANRRGHHRQQYQRVQEGATKAQLEREDREFLFELMQSGRLKAKPLITHRFPLKDLVEAWKFIDGKQADYTQVVFTS